MPRFKMMAEKGSQRDKWWWDAAGNLVMTGLLRSPKRFLK